MPIVINLHVLSLVFRLLTYGTIPRSPPRSPRGEGQIPRSPPRHGECPPRPPLLDCKQAFSISIYLIHIYYPEYNF